MSTRNTSTASSQEASGHQETQVPWNFLTELSRRQLALASESISVLCRGSEAMRGIQQDAAREASAYHGGVARKLLEPCQPADLMAIQSELLRFGLQGAGRYWHQLGAQMMQTQVDMMSRVSHMLHSDKAGPIASPLPNSFFLLDPLAWGSKHSTEEKTVTHH